MSNGSILSGLTRSQKEAQLEGMEPLTDPLDPTLFHELRFLYNAVCQLRKTPSIRYRIVHARRGELELWRSGMLLSDDTEGERRRSTRADL